MSGLGKLPSKLRRWIFRAARGTAPAEALRGRSLWQAADDPLAAYGEWRMELHGEHRPRPGLPRSLMGYNFRGGELRCSFWLIPFQGVGQSTPIPACFADCSAHLDPWPIGADEALDGEHPMLVRAWIARAEIASMAPSGAIGIAEELARCMAGRAPLCGLGADCARSLASSMWGRTPLGQEICQRAAALCQRMAIESSSSPSLRRAAPKRI